MNIWWCEFHGCSGFHGDDSDYCYEGAPEFSAANHCHMVEKRLVHSAALIVEKVNGEWPKWAVEKLRYDVAALAECGAVEILDELAGAMEIQLAS